MGFLDKLTELTGGNKGGNNTIKGIIDTGRNKNTGGHDHRSNKGDDRTPSQKEGDNKRRK